jgi:hypothetical protein
MPFLVIADSNRPGGGTFRAEKTTRTAAFETAVELMGQGIVNVTITDEEGRVYRSTEFAKFFAEGL